jgi:hypothetical protein
VSAPECGDRVKARRGTVHQAGSRSEPFHEAVDHVPLQEVEARPRVDGHDCYRAPYSGRRGMYDRAQIDTGDLGAFPIPRRILRTQFLVLFTSARPWSFRRQWMPVMNALSPSRLIQPRQMTVANEQQVQQFDYFCRVFLF